MLQANSVAQNATYVITVQLHSHRLLEKRLWRYATVKYLLANYTTGLKHIWVCPKSPNKELAMLLSLKQLDTHGSMRVLSVRKLDSGKLEAIRQLLDAVM